MDFNNTGTMKSPFSPRVRQSIPGRRPIGLSSSKMNQSKFMQSTTEQTGDVIYKTPLTTVETYGQPLPVMVTEALTFASGKVSVRLSPCGWCLVVSGRRILVWPRSLPTQSDEDSPVPAGMLAARELTLPQTDLAHKADLVVLFYEGGAQMPSCIGVSPEGIVRYWPSVGQEGVYVDVSAELAGQECERLGEYSHIGLALATTTCTVVMINPTVVEGRAGVSCRTLRPPSGWLGGLGRRVSLLFFGAAPAQPDTKLVGVAVIGDSLVALVGGGPALQLWRDAELHEHSLRRALAAPLAPHGDPNSLEILALDVRASGPSGLLLLLAAGSVARSPDVRYAIAHVCVAEPASPRVTSLVPLRTWTQDASEAPRFLPLPHKAILYTYKYIAVVSTTLTNDKVEYIDVSADGDRILGAELCDGLPLVFSRKHGVLALSMAELAGPSLCESPLGSPSPSDMYDGSLSLYEVDPHEVRLVAHDACGKLKTAFLFHLRRDAAACRALLEELFPAAGAGAAAGAGDVDAALDRTVVAVARELLDDAPAGDPRWACAARGGVRVALGSSAALHAQGQLQDKQRALALLLAFLRAQGLWRRLARLSREAEAGEGSEPTESVLGGLADRLVAALALRRLQLGPHAQVVDAAIVQVSCADEDEEPAVAAAVAAGVLAPSDACFRRVTGIWRVLHALARARPPAAAALHVAATVLAEVQRARRSATRLPASLLPPLVELLRKALAESARTCPEPTQRAQLLEAAGSLAELLLEEADPCDGPAYRRLRGDIIRPFVEEGQPERAAALADKFKDFDMLVDICLRGDDLERLYGYMDKYADEGMPEVAFARLLEGGRRAALARAGGTPRLRARLRRWLAAEPARAPLLALQLLAAPRPAAAAHALAALAAREARSVARMTTMASLAKLCLVASDEVDEEDSDAWRKVEYCLSLGEQHETLPRDVRVHYGLDAEDTRVLPPEDLIEMYIESESESLTEYDYKKALDLTNYIQDMERRDDLRLKVWCACIARSAWARCGAAEPEQELRSLMFFRLVELVHVMGGDVDLELPALEDVLTAPSLAELLSEPRCHFLVKYAYECLHARRMDD